MLSPKAGKTFCTDFCNKAHKLQHMVWPFPFIHSFIYSFGQPDGGAYFDVEISLLNWLLLFVEQGGVHTDMMCNQG